VRSLSQVFSHQSIKLLKEPTFTEAEGCYKHFALAERRRRASEGGKTMPHVGR
jgi:hypothetical protein